MRLLRWRLALLLVSASSCTLVSAQQVGSGDFGKMGAASEVDQPIRDIFLRPPVEARPRVWWHWLNGNVSESGIEQDLAWMERIGIGGVQNFDGSLDTPQVVEKRLPYLSTEWGRALRKAVATARSRGLEFTIASSSGWSETGGPWVKPEQAMKKLVWSELDVVGGRRVTAQLPQPPSVTGPFADVPAAPFAFGATQEAAGAAKSAGIPERFYSDSRVFAYRLPPAERPTAAAITASNQIDASKLSDGKRADSIKLAVGESGSSWIQFAYDRPQTMRAASVTLKPFTVGPLVPVMPKGSIEASEDGKTFRTLAVLPPNGSPQQTLAFPATTARYFRLRLDKGYAPLAFGGLTRPLPAGPAHEVFELSFHTGAHVERFEDKAGFTTPIALKDYATDKADAAAVVAPTSVVDITDRVAADGKVNWTPPAGRWRIVRLGWSLTGRTVHPASPEGTGLEVDKLNRRHVSAYMQTYLGLLEKAVGPGKLGPDGIQYMLNDSYEALAANWTDDMLAQFRDRRGYDPLPFLPVLTGRVVKSAQASDQFLWDFRRTLADLIADAHYGEISRALSAHGMGRYGESHEGGRAFVGDGMEVKKTATVPMGAAWAERQPARYNPDLIESASVAHLYGQNIVAAESFTVSSHPSTGIMPYSTPPEKLKPYADAMMANGVNRFVIHTSVHQPTEKPGPGIGLGEFGQWFTRKETWAELAGAWIGYLTRSSALLQHGRFAADIAWFYGEDDNITAVYPREVAGAPDGLAFDFINGDALRSVLDVENGALTVPSGARYRILFLDTPAKRMTLPTLRKLAELVDRGAVVVGQKPTETPSLGDDEAEFHRLADHLWSAGKIYATIGEAQRALKLPAAALFPGAPRVAFVHRITPDVDIFYVANLGDAAVDTVGAFRVAGKAPQVWRADDATIREASYTSDGTTTKVPLKLAAHDAAFVVFARPATAPSRLVPAPVTAPVTQLSGPWQIEFQQAGAQTVRTNASSLTSWTQDPRPEIRYFSGTATYSSTFRIPRKIALGERILIDLGEVKNLARISVNGHEAGIAWKPPFKVDITDAAREGRNTLSIEVANLWPNRIIGDKQPGETRKHVEMTRDGFAAESSLLTSGLLGPVTVLSETEPSVQRILP